MLRRPDKRTAPRSEISAHESLPRLRGYKSIGELLQDNCELRSRLCYDRKTRFALCCLRGLVQSKRIVVEPACQSARGHADATSRIRSHRSAAVYARRSRQARKFSVTHDGPHERRGCRCTEAQKPIRRHARKAFAHSHLVLRARNARTGPDQPVRNDRVVY